MTYTTRFFLIVLFIAAVLPVNSACAQSSLSEQLAQCAAVDNDQARLACYDALVRSETSVTGPKPHDNFIQPPAAFLDSSLVAEAWKSDYHLKVRGFVKLISHAVMENKKPVTIQGWTRDNHDYVLHITMRTPIDLHFLPREVTNAKTSMSLLREVTMGDHTVGAGEFILIIAAMNPDE